jgi:hypothetical protein
MRARARAIVMSRYATTITGTAPRKNAPTTTNSRPKLMLEMGKLTTAAVAAKRARR